MRLKLYACFITICTMFGSSAFAQTGTSSRLIGSTQYSLPGYSGNFINTLYYSYSGTRGGDLNNMLKFDTSYYDTAAYSVSGPSKPAQYRWVQSFDANNNLLLRIGAGYDPASKKYVDGDSLVNTYDGRNNLLTSTDYRWNKTTGTWDNATNNIYTYDAFNHMLSEFDDSWMSGSKKWIHARIDSFSYTPAGNVATQIIYSIAGSPTKTSVQYTYDASNKNIQTTYFNWNETTARWDTSARYLYAYSAAHDMQSALWQEYGHGIWNNSLLDVYNYDAGHNRVSDTSFTWNTTSHSFANTALITDNYNSYNQVHREVTYTWSGGAWAPEYEQDNYYEAYTTGVNNVAPAISDIVVYPNPAGQLIYVVAKTTQQQENTIRITDINGRLLYQTVTNTSQDPVAIPVSQLAAGNYFVTVGNKDGAVTKQFAVQR